MFGPLTILASRWTAVMAVAALAAMPIAYAASAAPSAHLTPVVVELFTAQGCPSCPPADEFIADLSARPDVLALTFGVPLSGADNPRDMLSQPAFAERQSGYSESLRKGWTYTPQVVVDGSQETSGNDRDGVGQLVAAHQGDGPVVTLSAGAVRIAAGRRPGQPADVWLIHFDPNVVQVPVRADEDTDKTAPAKNVVRAIARIGAWNGQAETLALPAAPDGLATAVLVQEAGVGRIFAAAAEIPPGAIHPVVVQARLNGRGSGLHAPGRAGRIIHHHHA